MQQEHDCIDNGQRNYSNFASPARHMQKCYAQAEMMEDVGIWYGSDRLKFKFQPYEGKRHKCRQAGRQKPDRVSKSQATSWQTTLERR